MKHAEPRDAAESIDADVIRKIRCLLCDASFLTLESNLMSLGFFSILGTTHRERWHSAFLAWLLNPGASHGLGDFPFRRLLARMATADLHEDTSEQARKYMPPLHEIEEVDFLNCRVWPDAGSKDQRRELTVSTSTPKLSFDAVIAAEMALPLRVGAAQKPSRLLFVFENKVKAKEGVDQTDDYAKWAFDDRVVNEQVFSAEANGWKGKFYRALLFLYWPSNPEKPEKGRAKSPYFRNLTYQELVDEIIGPCEKHPALSAQGAVLIREYLHNLAHQDEDQETVRIAVTPEEETLVKAIWDKHEKALNTLAKAGGQDADAESGRPDVEMEGGQSLVKVGDLVRARLLANGDKLRYKRGDVDEIVEVAERGDQVGIRVNGEIYSAPSSAAKELYGQVCQGWNQFKVESASNPRSQGKTLSELREIYRGENEEPGRKYSLGLCRYASAVLRAHRRAFLALLQVTRKIDGKDGFKLPDSIFGSAPKQWVDYSTLLPILQSEDVVWAHFKEHPEKTARINLKAKPPIFYLGDDKEGLSGLQATKKVAAECGVLTPSGSYQWAAHWCVLEGKHAGELFSLLMQKVFSESAAPQTQPGRALGG